MNYQGEDKTGNIVELTLANGRMIKSPDMVNHPPHYTTGKIEVIDFIEDQKLPYHLGNCVKYICRAPYKGTPEQDIAKALWYLKRYVEFTQKETNAN